MVERGTGPGSLMKGLKGCQEPGSSLTVCDVCCVVQSLSLCWRKHIPFIDEGDGLTSERETVCALPSLVAHVVGYKMVCRRS